jgi:hypothetical protein
MRKIIPTLLTLIALNSNLSALPPQNPDLERSAFSIGVSAPCHGLVALRGVYEFNDRAGIQADIGFGFTSIDGRYQKRITPWVNAYGYAGFIGISPWMYRLNNLRPEGAAFAAEAGVGMEFGGTKGLSLGIEGGLILPIPPEPNTGAFRVDANIMYRIPKK